MNVIHKMNNFHQALSQNNECGPTMSKKKDCDVTTLQGMIAELKGHISQLSKGFSFIGNSISNGGSRKSKCNCFECGSEDHLVKDPPRKQATWNGQSNIKKSFLEE